MTPEERLSAYLASQDLPEELKQVPQANVGFVGLDPRHSETHRQILDAFTGSRKSDRLSIHYSLIPADREFPPTKPKRTTYEWFLPKGIIKRRWMRKHLQQLPAVVIIFFDLEWGDPAWTERASECCSRVKAIRAALTSHQTRLAVVLVQRAAAGDDPLAADHAAELCAICDLPPKSLWVLPATDHLAQYAMRLESAFHELAQTYYQQRVKTVRGHRELLNKSHHQALFVRHQFKLGFFSEIRQDVAVAHKAYQQAYTHLLELRTTDLTLCEIKVVAAMLSFKVCRLAFRQNLPRDAIAHFRRHVELFRSRVGPTEMAAEHSGWMAQQYQWFGEVFDQAVHMGLPAIQTQHPGIYFEQAAQHGRQRRRAAQQLNLDMGDYPGEDPLAALATTDYYGQRPWRPPGRNVELMDSEKEKRGVLAIQVLECCVSHHNLVIPLLSAAISQYKQYRCPRMKERLLVLLAEEYALSGDHDKAVILLGRVLQLYRAERWSPLVASVAAAGLRAAYAARRPDAYLSMAAALQACSTEPAERARIDANLHRLLRCEPPEPEPGCPAVDGWQTALVGSGTLLLELSPPDSLLAVRAAFSASHYQQACPPQVCVELENLSSAALQLRSVSVSVSGRTGSVAAEGELSPAQQRRLLVELPPQLHELGTVLWLESVGVVMGSESGLTVEARWKPNIGDEHLHRTALSSSSGAGVGEGGLWATVAPRPARLTLSLEHDPPALVGEVYPLSVLLNCDSGGGPLCQIYLDVALTTVDDETARNTFVIVAETSHCLSELVSLPCPSLAAGDCTRLQLGVQCLTSSPRLLQLTARYTETVHTVSETVHTASETVHPVSETVHTVSETVHAVSETVQPEAEAPRSIGETVQPSEETGQAGAETVQDGCQGRVTLSLPLEVVQPFQMSVYAVSAALEPVDSVAAGQTMLMLAQVTNTGPHAVRLRSTQLVMEAALFSVSELADTDSDSDGEDELSGALLRDLELQPGEAATECVPVTARDTAGTAPAGSYTLTWNRLSEDDRPVSTVVPAPAVSVQAALLLVTLELPAHGVVRRPLTATYAIHNRASRVCCLLLQLEPSEAFMFAGHKRYQFRVAPGGCRTLQYQLYPLLSGRVTLPRLRLTLHSEAAPAADAAQTVEAALQQLPTHVYVMPQGKGDHSAAPVPAEADNRGI